MRTKPSFEEEVEIPMSPLIDCVFLLLIFFLVTSMIKKFEKHVEVTPPNSEVAISQTSNRNAYIIGLDSAGSYYREDGIRSLDGAIQYRPVKDISLLLNNIAENRGLKTPIYLTIDKETNIQQTMDAIDICTIHGFENISVKLRDAKAVHPEDRNPGMRY